MQLTARGATLITGQISLLICWILWKSNRFTGETVTVQSRESHSHTKLRTEGRMGCGVVSVQELCKWKAREREDSPQRTKKWAFIIYSFEMQKQGGRYSTSPTKPSSLFPSHLHWKDCRVCVKAEAYELHGTVWAPLSQFILPHVGEHARALSKGKANSTYSCHAHICNA